MPASGAMAAAFALRPRDNGYNSLWNTWLLPRVDGQFTGTTDEILQWAACKWGLPDNLIRADAVTESTWFEYLHFPTDASYGGGGGGSCYWDRGCGDPFSSPTTASTTYCNGIATEGLLPSEIHDYQKDPLTSAGGYPWTPTSGMCPQTFSILGEMSWDDPAWQAPHPAYPGNQNGTFPFNRDSTAAAADYWGAYVRGCYEGWESWLAGTGTGTYAAGDLWGCMGSWFAGEWHSSAANSYIAEVQGHENNLTWLTASFDDSSIQYACDPTYGCPSSPSPSPSPSPSASPSPTPSPTPPPSSGIPNYDHIVQILMENHDYSEVVNATYIASLRAKGATATNYFSTDSPSLPNYAELTSGQSFPNATSDCSPAPGCNSSARNLADTITASGRTWKNYAENMGTPCNVNDSGNYATRHVPFLYYTDIPAATCQANVIDYSNFASALASTTSLPSYSFITPNLIDDMHDGTVQQGDTWLSQNVPAILNSPAFTTQHSLLILTWDEGSSTNQVLTIFVGSSVLVGGRSSTPYTHYSLLRTIEASWGLTTLTSNDGGASPMTDLFGTSAGPPPLSAAASASQTSGSAPVTINFTGSASGGTSPYRYSWSFGDGASSASQNPSHTYTAAGTYSAVLKVTDATSATATATALSITVSGPLSASARAVPAAGAAPLTVAFTGRAAGGTSPYAYSWAFGDGATSTSQSPSHVYSAAGAYTATLTVTDASAHTASATASVVVSPTLGQRSGAGNRNHYALGALAP